jgi:ABC-2 type transport system permease protein
MNSLHIAVLLVKRMFGRGRRVLGFILLPALAVSLAITVLQGYGSGEIVLEVLNRDRGGLGQVLVEEWEAHPELQLHEADTRKAGEDQVIRQLAEAVIIIPEAFTEDLASGKTPKVELNQLRYNEAVFLARNMVQIELEQLTAVVKRLRETEITDPASLTERIQSIYLEKSERGTAYRIEKPDYMAGQQVTVSTGLLLLFIMTLVVSAVSVIQEDRKTRTFQRMFASPLNQTELMLGYFLGCMLTGTAQILIVLITTRVVMGADFGMEFFSQWLVLEFFLLAALGISAAVAGIVRNSEHAGALQSWVTTPSCMVGGCFWPIGIMPEPMQKLANFVPQKWVIEAVDKLASGASLRDIPYQLGILFLFAVIFLSFGTAIVRPGEDGGG